MALQDDGTIAGNTVLLRVLDRDPNWTTNKGGRYRPASLAFYSSDQEISYFIDGPDVLAEVQRIFPNHEIAKVPASVVRGVGFAIERRPAECPSDFRCDPAVHVVAGPVTEIKRAEHQKKAGSIAKDPGVTIVQPHVQSAQ
jgi:hypothetical protein